MYKILIVEDDLTISMLAICKYWYDKYGAIQVTISHDVLEMSVPVPVAEGDAIELAKEHYAFTPDRVDQHHIT